MFILQMPNFVKREKKKNFKTQVRKDLSFYAIKMKENHMDILQENLDGNFTLPLIHIHMSTVVWGW
jgi:hypothetical protein